MTPEKFTIRSLFILAAILFIAVLTQGTSYVNFFLINQNQVNNFNSQIHEELVACDTVYIQKVSFLTSKEDSLSTSLEKLLSIKTSKVSNLYSPFYKSNLSFDIKVDEVKNQVSLNLIGDLNILSDCQHPYIDNLLRKSILDFYPDYSYEILLNGSKDDYFDLIQPL